MKRISRTTFTIAFTGIVIAGCSRSEPAKVAMAPAAAPTAAPVEPVAKAEATPVSTKPPLLSLPAPPAGQTTVAAKPEIPVATVAQQAPTTPPLVPVSTTTTTTTVTTEQTAAPSVPTTSVVASPIISSQPIVEPELKPEIITPEPSQEHVWIPGDWERTPDQWKWVPGHWDKAPFGNARWVNGYWRYETGQYVWIAGHWGSADPGQGLVVAKPIEIPPVPVEPTPVPVTPPQPGYSWVPAHWEWSGYGWTFVAGHYTLAPAPQAEWIPGYWKQGVFGQWRWIAGHWKVK